MIKPNITTKEEQGILDDLLKPSEPVVENEIIQEDVEFNGLIWEPLALRDGIEKKSFYYDESINQLNETHYFRHPSSSEYFALFCQYLDGGLNEEQTNLVKDISNGKGEFFCQGINTQQTGLFGRKKDLMIYPRVLWFPRDSQNESYDLFNITNGGITKVFKINDLKLGEPHYFKNIKDKHDDLIEYLTSRKFDVLPEQIKDCGRIDIPSLDYAVPIGIIFSRNKYIITNYFDGKMASRGVRIIK